MSALKEYAIWYASFGWPIFPCKQLGKEPDCLHGCRDGTTDLDKIESWWNQNPNRNIGLLCGDMGNVYVIDVDVRPEDGVNGFRDLREFPSLPDTCVQSTPRRGVHALYSRGILSSDTIRNKNKFRPGLDIRANGYYIVLSPSTVAGGNEYAWKQGRAPWEMGLAAFPDFMRPEANVPMSIQIPATIQAIHLEGNLKRASKYLAQIDAAVQGNCGHNKLLWAAQCMIYGFLLSDEEAFNILALEYNPRCNPPWNMSSGKDHKDFCRKIIEARKNPPRHPKGWLLAASAEDDYEEASPRLKASIKSLLETVKKDSTTNSSVVEYKASSPVTLKGIEYAFSHPTKDEFEFVTSPFGYLGKFCSWANEISVRSQPILTLGGTLAFFGALFGRKVKDELDFRTNIYCMGIGQSSAGKQHIQNCIRKVIDEVGCDQLLGACDFASDIAIENTLAKRSSVVFLLDEIGHILMHLKSSPTSCTDKIISTLMRIWSSAQNSYTPKAYADSDDEVKVIQPCMSIYGTSTHGRFIEGISPSELDDGWLSRCLVFHTDTFPFKNRVYKKSMPPDDICEFVNAWSNRKIEPKDKATIKAWQKHTGDKCTKANPTQIEIKATSEAEKILVEFDLFSRTIGIESPKVKCLWAKAEENARKLSLTLAASVNYDNPIIDGACADYGCKLTSYLLRDFGSNIVGQLSSNPQEEKKNRIWSLINKKGRVGCNKKQLAESSGWSSRKERIDLLEDLREAGRIATKLVNGVETHWTSEYYLN